MAEADTALGAIKSVGTAPPDIGAKAQMAPILAAGVDLARRLLFIISGALAVLVLILAISEWREQGNFSALAQREIALIDAGASGDEDVPHGLSEAVQSLHRAALAPEAPVAPGDAAAIKPMVELAIRHPLLTAEQRADLTGPCASLPAPGVADRGAILDRCAATLETILRPRDRAATHDNIQALAKTMTDERTAYRAFWIQVAQLILINLLLPILTALLGYVFGTQQGAKPN